MMSNNLAMARFIARVVAQVRRTGEDTDWEDEQEIEFSRNEEGDLVIEIPSYIVEAVRKDREKYGYRATGGVHLTIEADEAEDTVRRLLDA